MKIIEGHITSPFGWRKHPLTNMQTFHNGIDIAAPIGTEIVSPVEGIIKQTYTHSAGGLTLILSDKSGKKRFGFCHLSKIFFPSGTPVTRGSLLALSGNTGNTTGPHLHFTAKEGGQWHEEQYTGGQWVNPAKYLEL